MIGVRMLNISRNLMTRWADVEEILSVVSGVTTLIMKYVNFNGRGGLKTDRQRFKIQGRVRETWQDDITD